MLLKKYDDAPRLLLMIGMASLLIASVGHWLARPTHPAVADVTDAVYGVFMGIAIGAILMSVRAGRRERQPRDQRRR